jgi:excisionase family DNA binding protein
MKQNHSLPSRLITKREIAEFIGDSSTKTVDRLMRERKIPYTKIGHRTVRFDREKVLAALAKLEVRSVG